MQTLQDFLKTKTKLLLVVVFLMTVIIPSLSAAAVDDNVSDSQRAAVDALLNSGIKEESISTIYVDGDYASFCEERKQYYPSAGPCDKACVVEKGWFSDTWGTGNVCSGKETVGYTFQYAENKSNCFSSQNTGEPDCKAALKPYLPYVDESEQCLPRGSSGQERYCFNHVAYNEPDIVLLVGRENECSSTLDECRTKREAYDGGGQVVPTCILEKTNVRKFHPNGIEYIEQEDKYCFDTKGLVDKTKEKEVLGLSQRVLQTTLNKKVLAAEREKQKNIMCEKEETSGLIPCGQTKSYTGDITDDVKYVTCSCEFKHLIILIQNIIKFLILLGAPVAALLFSWGGFLYLSGDQNKITTAKSIFSNVMIGFVLMLTAWGIVSFITSTLLDSTKQGTGEGQFDDLLDNSQIGGETRGNQ